MSSFSTPERICCPHGHDDTSWCKSHASAQETVSTLEERPSGFKELLCWTCKFHLASRHKWDLKVWAGGRRVKVLT